MGSKFHVCVFNKICNVGEIMYIGYIVETPYQVIESDKCKKNLPNILNEGGEKQSNDVTKEAGLVGDN